MAKFKSEIETMNRQGYALAAVLGGTRVYRGMGQVVTRGERISQAALAEFADISTQIQGLGGHIGDQSPRRNYAKRAK